MRVLHLINDTLYGSSAMVRQLAVALARLGVDVTLSSFRQVAVAPLEGVSVYPVRLPPSSLPGPLKLWERVRRVPDVAKQLQAHRYDLLHCHDLFSGFYGWRAARQAGVPVVATLHGEVGYPWSIRTYEALYRRLCARFDGLITPSRDEAARLRRWIDSRKLHWIVNGIDVARWREEVSVASGLRAELGIADDAFVVGMIGRLSPEKGQILALQALADPRLARERSLQLLIAGEGPMEKRLRLQATRFGLEGRVRFLGYVHEMARLYRTLDLLLHPSSREASPMVILEALAAGVPVIGTPVGEVVYMLEGGAGHLVPCGRADSLAQAVSELMWQPDRRRAMSQQGLERVCGYDHAHIAQRYLEEVYRPVLERTAGKLRASTNP